VQNEFAKRIGHVIQQCERVCDAVDDTLKGNQFPLVISGDHSSALGTMSGIKKHYQEKRMGVVWIDAHADLHSPFTSPSGNIHGMPLAAALNSDNLECKINEVAEDQVDLWDQLKSIGINGAKAIPSDVVFFGLRDTESPEDEFMARNDIRNFTVEETRFRGLETCIHEALDQLKDCDVLYISFDVDSMDCDRISYGTGTPVPRGFDPEEIVEIISKLLLTDRVACLEFVEINPLLDNRGNKMAETAIDILLSLNLKVE
jgi:arginase